MLLKTRDMMQKKQVHPVEYKSVTSRARTMETRSIAPQSAPVKWGRITPQGGFTLIEILVVMVIFTTSFLALAAGATTVMKSKNGINRAVGRAQITIPAQPRSE